MNWIHSKTTCVVRLVGVVVLAQVALAADEPNGIIPNDPLFPLQWELHNCGQGGAQPGVDINATKAWEITTGDPNIIVAIISYGLDLDHPDLVHNLVPGFDFVDDDDQPYPRPDWNAAYDTADAGHIAAEGDNGIGVAGVTWHCKIMPVRIYDGVTADGRYARAPLSIAAEAAAWRWAATHGADIIHFDHNQNTPAPDVQRSAFVDITKPGGIGRNGKGCVLVIRARYPFSGPGWVYPAVYPEMISVDAVDPWDRLLYTHDPASRVDVVAPAGAADPVTHAFVKPITWTTDMQGEAGYSEGDYCEDGGLPTAVSTVSGVAALILSVEPNLTNEEVRHYLCRSAHDLGAPGRDDEYGWGRVDARAALDMVLARRADLNRDGVVDENDLTILTAAMDTNDLSADIAPAKRDAVIDAKDRELLMRYLGTEVPELNLIAHWKLDEKEGSIATCTTGTQAILHGGPVWQPVGGEIRGALQFDGVDDYVSTKCILDPSFRPFSVFAWVKGGAPGQVIVSQVDGHIWLAVDAAGVLKTEVSGARKLVLTSSAVITDGQWHRVGLTWDGAFRTLYVDGFEVARDAKSSGSLKPSTGGLHFGADGKLTPGSFWCGLLDDVRIYNRAVRP
jgi:hypothetical protein